MTPLTLLTILWIAAADAKPSTRPSSGIATPRSPAVRWVDAETATVLFQDIDMVRFDWQKQVFELTRERAIDLMCLPQKLRRDFVVRDNDGDIYRGCFMSPFSSMSFDGPTMCIDTFGVSGMFQPPLFHVAGGYPGAHGPGADKRFHSRLRQKLAEAGLLKTIEEPQQVLPIETTFLGWHGDALGRQVSVTLFPETPRIGRPLRFVARFARTASASGTPQEREQDARKAAASQALQERKAGEAPAYPGGVCVSVVLRTGQAGPELTGSQWFPAGILNDDPFGTAACGIRLDGDPPGRNTGEASPGEATLRITVEAMNTSESAGARPIATREIPPVTVRLLPAANRPHRQPSEPRPVTAP